MPVAMTSRTRFWPFGDGFYRGIDGIGLVVARSLAAAVIEVILQDDFFFVRRECLSTCSIWSRAAWGVGNWSSVREASFSSAQAGAVVKDKAVAVG